MRLNYFALVLLCKSVSGVIYSINETEYARMPPLYKLDDYDLCMLGANAVYCLVDADLYTDTESDLMTMIQNYSANTVKHFNHSQIHRGVCLMETCEKHLRKRNVSDAAEWEAILGECLNRSMWENYNLKVQAVDVNYCERANEMRDIDVYDIIVAVIYSVIIIMNIVGSIYGYRNRETCSKENSILLCFSLRHNWSRLTAPSGAGGDPRFSRLKLFNGLRTMTMICVFFSHTVLIMAFSYVDNPLYIEKSYDDPMKQILFNGSLVTFTFFTMSSFLLAYNIQIYGENRRVTWHQLPKGILLRWLRLTPSYALVLAWLGTWCARAGGGPAWRRVVAGERAACRRHWWAHLLYVNNYLYDDVHCAPQTWYLAADTQLFCLGLALCIAFQTTRARKIALGLLFVIGLVIPALQTYIQDLDAVVIQAPETYRNLYAEDATFRTLYASGHANLATYSLGLAAGILTYHWQESGFDIAKYKKYRWVYWSMFPLGVAVILTGGLFYVDGPRASITYRVIYAMLYKPIFQFLVLVLVVGAVFKFETMYRGVMEWRGWTWCGRVSYCSFLLHTTLQRALVGSQRQPIHMSDYYVMLILSATIFLTFALGAVFWLLVEAPIYRVIKILTSDNRHMQKNIALAAVETSNGVQSKL